MTSEIYLKMMELGAINPFLHVLMTEGFKLRLVQVATQGLMNLLKFGKQYASLTDNNNIAEEQARDKGVKPFLEKIVASSNESEMLYKWGSKMLNEYNLDGVQDNVEVAEAAEVAEAGSDDSEDEEPPAPVVFNLDLEEENVGQDAIIAEK